MIQTVAQLINHLSGLPPMMSVVGWNEDTATPKYINKVEVINDGTVPILRIGMSEYPNLEDIKKYTSYEEQLAEQREKAFAMARETRRELDNV